MTTQIANNLTQVRYGSEPVDGINIFYRESGSAPATSSRIATWLSGLVSHVP